MIDKDKIIKISIPTDCYDELRILAIRTKKSFQEVARDVLVKQMDKKKDKQQIEN